MNDIGKINVVLYILSGHYFVFLTYILTLVRNYTCKNINITVLGYG